MPARLYAVPASHPCATVERAFGLKGVAYRRIDLVPPLHVPAQLLRFGRRTVPGVVFDDGERVSGSRPIVRALERRAPEPALLPADARARERVERAEEWGDQVLQPLVRRVLWTALARAPRALPSYGAGSPTRLPDAVARAGAPLLAAVERRLNGATDVEARADLTNLPHHLRRIEDWLDDGVLGGPEPNAADLQIAPSLRLLATIEDLGPALDRPGGELGRRLVPAYPGHTPAGALPAAWLPA